MLLLGVSGRLWRVAEQTHKWLAANLKVQLRCYRALLSTRYG